MNRIHVYSPPLTMSDDPRLVQIFDEVRKPKVNWPFLKGVGASLALSGLMWYALIELGLWLWRRL